MSVWGPLGAWCYSVRQISTFICNTLQGKSEIDHYIDIFKVGGVPFTEGHRYKNPNVSSSIGLDLELQTLQPTSNSVAIGLIRGNSRLCLLDPVPLPPSSEEARSSACMSECALTMGRGGERGFSRR